MFQLADTKAGISRLSIATRTVMNPEKIFSVLRTNGCHNVHDGRSIRQIVYTNMIWMATFSAIIIHTILILFFVPVPAVTFLAFVLPIHLAFIAVFFLVKYNFSGTGKHWLILSTYITVGLVDHLFGKKTYTFLHLFAFLPAAMNIFSFKKNKFMVIVYTLFPLAYTLFTRLAEYNYPAFKNLGPSSTTFLIVLNISEAFMLFVVFATYMILNNLAKQQKLLLHSTGLQTTLDNSAGAIWSIDKDFNLMAANTKYAESLEKEFGVTGLKRGVNIKRHTVWEKLPESLKNQYYTVLSGQEILHEITINERSYEIKGVPIYDVKGNIGGATFGSRDVTAKKKAVEALIAAKKAAEDAGNAKARFLSNISHELRTPLNGIIGITRIMQDEKMLPEQLSNFKTLQDLSEHTLQIINNVLDFAKIEAGKASLENNRFNLRRFIGKINSIFSGTAQLRGIKFIVEINGEADIFIKGDEVRLSQVLINLIGNSFKFTEKGSITLGINICEADEKGYHSIQFSVTDTGIGIKQENLAKIFESFSQADTRTTRSFGGTGLGLSIAEKILNLMQSSITVESNYGEGSVFRFNLSLAQSSFAPNTHEKVHVPDLSDLSGRRILLAEDNRVNQLVAARMLEKWKTLVTIAGNGQEALEKARQGLYDIILMDLDMPVMDGYESTALIKDIHPHIPVIALTAASFDDMDNFLINKGFSDVVQKPFAPDDLFNKIVSILHRA